MGRRWKIVNSWGGGGKVLIMKKEASDKGRSLGISSMDRDKRGWGSYSRREKGGGLEKFWVCYKECILYKRK